MVSSKEKHTLKRKPRLLPKDRDPVTEDEFTEVVRQILGARMDAPKRENHEPTKEERERRYKLVRKGA